MKFAFKICLIFAAAFLLASCEVVFENSIADNSKIDRRILGKWKNVDSTEKGLIEFSKKSAYQINVATPDDEAGENFTASTVKVGNYYYLNVSSKNKENLIARYEIRNNEMTLWILDENKIRGKLKGYSKSSGAVIVTDSSKKIKEFLKSKESNEAFEFFGKLKKSEETTK